MPTTKSYLWADHEPPHFPRLERALDVDVAIIGGGVTGLTAARLLDEAGLRVAVMEAWRVGSGETKHTTAHLTEVLDGRLRQLVTDFGEDGARLAVRGQRAGIERIATFVADLGLDCGFDRLPGYLVAETVEEARSLDAEAEVAQRLGLDAHLVSDTPLPFPVARALRFNGQAQVNPREYLLGLLAGLDGGGCRVFEMTAVKDIVDGTPCRVTTDSGVVITARNVIVATNVPISTRYLIHPKLAAYRSYAMALALPGEPPHGLFWDMKDPYHYVRGQVIEGIGYLIVGGEDHKVGVDHDSAGAFDRLDAYVKDRFGRTSAATDFRWSGQIIEPADGLPFIGRSALASHVFVATGYSGNGMTSGTLAAMMLSDQIQGVENPWRALLDATRIKPLASARAFVAENADFPKHLVGDRLRLSSISRKDDLDRITPGEGAVVSVAGTKLAVYRNHEGSFGALSPVCTHLGCHVRWNTSAKSWDCPCHGSRFDTTGRVLNGPAIHPLEFRPIPNPEVGAPTALATRAQRGAVAGLVATGAMSSFMWLAQRSGLLGKAPPRKITERLLASAVGQRPARRYRQAFTAGAHLAFGATAGALFVMGSGRFPQRRQRVIAGAFWGAAIWAAMYGYALPAAKLMPTPAHDRVGRPTAMAIAHLIYGWVLGALS